MEGTGVTWSGGNGRGGNERGGIATKGAGRGEDWKAGLGVKWSAIRM